MVTTAALLAPGASAAARPSSLLRRTAIVAPLRPCAPPASSSGARRRPRAARATFSSGTCVEWWMAKACAQESFASVDFSVSTHRRRTLQRFSPSTSPLSSPAAHLTTKTDNAFTPELKKAIDAFIADNKVVLFIKGTKDFPACGFSQTAVNIFRSLNVPFETVNILEDDRLRTGMKAYSQWPTFPQVYLNGEDGG
jgi:Grx4 family monothiol glutaredoxin